MERERVCGRNVAHTWNIGTGFLKRYTKHHKIRKRVHTLHNEIRFFKSLILNYGKLTHTQRKPYHSLAIINFN